MDEEQTVQVVLPLDGGKARVVLSPIRVLPAPLEVIALAHVRSSATGRSKLTHASLNPLGRLPPCRNRRLVPRNTGIGGSLPLAAIASAKASWKAGFVAVSLARAMASSGAPANPLLKCSVNEDD